MGESFLFLVFHPRKIQKQVDEPSLFQYLNHVEEDADPPNNEDENATRKEERNMDIIALILAFVVLARLGKPPDEHGEDALHLDILQSPLGST